MTMKAPRNSTTDRTLPLNVRALRLWFAVEARISPRTAENRAARMFATPPRQTKHSKLKLKRNTPLAVLNRRGLRSQCGTRTARLSLHRSAMDRP